MEREEKNALYFIKKKINSNEELLTALKNIYEDEKNKGLLVQKKEKNKNKFDRYLSSCFFNEYSIINFSLLMSSLFMSSCLLEPRIGLSGFLLLPFFVLPALDILRTGYKQQEVKEGFLKYSKKTIKSGLSSILNKKNSTGRQKYDLYANELSLRSFEEISKYISKEEMNLLLKSRFDYESLHIYKEKFQKDKKYEEIDKYIENDLKLITVRSNLIEDMYKDKI